MSRPGLLIPRDDFDAELPKLPSMRDTQHQVSSQRVTGMANPARPHHDADDSPSGTRVLQVANRVICV